ncbi:MAG: hypothetical protein FWE62_04685, partial [Firmicutes bacterium]|nr:hypothetical protein [Bacillota bacterium]
MRKIVIALPKGKRLLEAAYGVFQFAGYTSAQLKYYGIDRNEQKHLDFASDDGRAAFLLVKNADIPQY